VRMCISTAAKCVISEFKIHDMRLAVTEVFAWDFQWIYAACTHTPKHEDVQKWQHYIRRTLSKAPNLFMLDNLSDVTSKAARRYAAAVFMHCRKYAKFCLYYEINDTTYMSYFPIVLSLHVQ